MIRSQAGSDGAISGDAPLSGVRVVDLSNTFMGPYSTRLLAQWGATVVKVEPPAGDVVRGIGDHTGTGLGPIFVNANTGKRSVCLDLKTPAGRGVLDDLIDTADVLVHSMRERALRSLRLTAAEVLARKASLVHCGFRGYGSGGRYRDLPAYDDIIQAACGIADLEGGTAGPPRYSRQALADKAVGVFGAASILAALTGAALSGRGRAIEVPMFETMVGFVLLDQQGGHLATPPTGPPGYTRTSSPFRRPYPTSDGFIAVMIYTDGQWERLFRLVGRPDLVADARFTSIRARTENIDVLYRLLETELAGDTTEHWLARLREADLPCGPVNTLESLFDDAHLDDVGFFTAASHPVLGAIRVPSGPAPVAGAHDSPAPLLGEQTREVLSELGRSEEGIAALLESGAARASAGSAPPVPVGAAAAQHGPPSNGRVTAAAAAPSDSPTPTSEER